MQVSIPDKLYFKIGEVAQLTGVKPHVLRYWESEFRQIRPVKSQGKQRLYRRDDIEFVLNLKDILYGQGYTIAGAKKILAKQAGSEKAASSVNPEEAVELLRDIRRDLLQLRASLEP
ncbi:transcriptional regulator, MerR family [Syntrophotalea carbinolica DSM 2380]|uniref:Transcriptional regulator, MerR family n=1 Tax=Syntrophotalea carbinolica (strain DSM 2380 / NBRC 103641 / GraBd1) TaxID=338963 RepID=Q3A4N6_SYNC1|nr:MerR family transcriptional regulator [Syntrophotalea carbinolica]ABA88671.1 transcriptional regulator, MerR family [Syntrophotalea carbinolica DSM 2380]